MTSICIETDYYIPCWLISKARKILNEYRLPPRVDSISYEETNMILFTKFTISITGSSPGEIKVLKTRLVEELGAL